MSHSGIEIARRLRVAVFVIAYRDDRRVAETVRRIPPALLESLAAIFVIDDRGESTAPSETLSALGPGVEVLPTPFDQRHGAKLKLGLSYALEQGFDLVALLHADGHYAPESLPEMIAPFAAPEVSAVMGSRMLEPDAARRSGMPWIRRAVNRALTGVQNRLLGSRLSEFHSGYRAYRLSELAAIPFQYNSDGYAFETEILIQLLGRGARLVEVPTPVFYGPELASYRGARYAFDCLVSTLRAVANRYHLVYHRRFDLEGPGRGYHTKRAPSSLHQRVAQQRIAPGTRVVDLGAGDAAVATEFHEAGARVVALDAQAPEAPPAFPFLVERLEEDFADRAREALGGPAELVVALDVIEHLSDPERTLGGIHRLLTPGGRLLASTANVAYLPIRLSLLLGQFNYGKRGILDVTHRRLFTIRTFRRALHGEGFRVDGVRGFGPPIQDVIGDTLLLRGLDRLAGALARLWPSLFAYQFLVEATRLDSVADVMARREVSRTEERSPPDAG